MQIKRLKLSGFKSFVEPAELRIEPGLTGVVGPNGCGKSNLLEALRWAMGEGSPRSLRGGGMEDVIFAGTAQRPARDFAEVSILAEHAPPGGEAREVEVVRRIERGAGSAYRVDGRDVRQKDVALLFADAATGAHSPALVSQGRIGAIIAARPAERRMMLEEAAGIAGLHVRRKDAEQKLRATEANLVRLDELIADMGARIAALRRQARAAERYRRLSEDIRLAEGRLIFARWRDAAAAAEVAQREAQTAEAAVHAAAEAQRAAAAHQADAVRRAGDARAAAEAAREAASEAAHRLAGLRAERNALAARIAELARAAETLERDRAREDVLGVDAAGALERLAQEERAAAAAVATATERRAALADRLGAAELAARDAELAMTRALAAQAAEQAEQRVAAAALAAARQRVARAEAEAQGVAADLARVPDPAPFLAARDAARAAQAAAEVKGRDAIQALAEAEAARDAADADRAAADADAAAARARLAALESEAKALSRALEFAENTTILAQMHAKAGYEAAIAAALGDDLDAAVGQSGKRRWTGAEVPADDPPLPAGAVPLSSVVTAPPQLARRLAQVGVVDGDDGSLVLAVGQRLVTPAGHLRRWDGYVAEDVGAAAAERLVRANRLAALQGALPGAQQALDAARANSTAATEALTAARTTIERARAAAFQAEAARRQAARDEDAAMTQLTRAESTRGALAERAERAAVEHDAAVAEQSTAAAALGALPDGSAIQAEVERLRQASEVARRDLADLRVEAASVAQSLEADTRRIDTARTEAKRWRARAGDAARRVAEMDARRAAIAAEQETLAGAPERLDAALADAERTGEAARAGAETARLAEREAEEALRETEATLARAGEALSVAREARAGAAARAESQQMRRVEMGRISGERFECPAAVLPERLGFASAEVGAVTDESARLERLTADRERLGPVNLVAERELAEVEAAHGISIAEHAELTQAIHRLRGSIGSLNREGRERLRAAFEEVDRHFRRLFTTLFAGGEAHLELVDSDDPLEAGLEIMAQPPGKKLSTLTLLSGGEQALTAVALIFGLFLTNPAPICVLDEVDAPLDDANIERFCDLLDAMTRETRTRYLIVTHNAVTMSRMHRLFGVTMVERGVSRLVSVDLGGAERLLAAE